MTVLNSVITTNINIPSVRIGDDVRVIVVYPRSVSRRWTRPGILNVSSVVSALLSSVDL